MRIGVIGPQQPPDCFAENIVDALVRMGHEGIALGPIRPLPRRQEVRSLVEIASKATTVDRALQSRLVRRIRELDLSLVITVQADLLPEIVASIRAAGCRIALWFPDAITNLGRMMMLVSPYDGLFFKEPLLVERARSMLDTPVHYLPEACNPRWHRPVEGEFDPSIVIAGNFYPWRAQLIERLAGRGLPIRLFGSPIPRWVPPKEVHRLHSGRYITKLEKARIFRNSSLVLNTMHPGEVKGVNARLFEATGSGATVLSDFRETLPALFQVDAELLTYESFDDLEEKARWLLDHPEEGRALGDRAHKKAHSEHTYEDRLRTMLSTLGMD